MITVEYLILCHNASRDDVRRVSIERIIDAIVGDFPVELHDIKAVIKLRYYGVDRGDYQIALQLVDADGNVKQWDKTKPLRLEYDDKAVTNTRTIIYGIPALKLEKPGEYALSALLNEEVFYSLPFYAFARPDTS